MRFRRSGRGILKGAAFRQRPLSRLLLNVLAGTRTLPPEEPEPKHLWRLKVMEKSIVGLIILMISFQWSGPEEIRCPGARHRVRSCQRRAADKQQSTGLLHLHLRISLRVIKKEAHPEGVLLFWWTRGDSNSRPLQCECNALPAALRAHGLPGYYSPGAASCQVFSSLFSKNVV